MSYLYSIVAAAYKMANLKQQTVYKRLAVDGDKDQAKVY